MQKKTLSTALASFVLMSLFAVLALSIAAVLYWQTREIMTEKLKERIIATAVTAAIQIEKDDIVAVQDAEAIGTDSYKRLVTILQEIRNVNKDVYYAYLLRPTEDPNTYAYIADADSMDPTAEVDLNDDGIIDESDALNTPGDDFDILEIPALVDALNFPTTDEEPIESDAYGIFLSGYAPIKDKGETIAVLALDVEVSDFIRLVSATLTPFAIFGGILLMLIAGQTIALVRMWGSRVEFFKELDRQKDELLSIVSHQLATPITSVKWYLEMLGNGDMGELKKEQKDHVKSMQAIALNLADLVSMILDVSRIQLGRMKIDKQKLNLADFYDEIFKIVEPKAMEKRVKLVKHMPKSLPVANLDRRYTHMTIENLLSNAIKYTPEGGDVTLDVEIRNNTMYCTVKDTGCGIPEKEKDKIFGKLFRASNVRNTVEGNGFGLYVAKGAVEAQGGKIRFESTEGKGTTFFVELPLQN